MNYWPRWIRAIRGKTLALSMAQMGAYDRLLDYYYEEEQPLPSDIDECCRIAGAASKQDRADVQKVLAKFFVLSATGYAQERADAEIVIGLKKIDAAKANGKAGGRPKGSRNKPTGLDAANPAETQSEPTTKAPHHHTSLPTVKKVPRGSGPACPEDVDQQVWADWLELRQKKRAPVTATVVSGAISEAAKAGMTLDEFLRVWCRRGSQGLEASWLTENERQQQRGGETAWQRSQRETIEQMTGGLVSAKPPGVRASTAEIIDVTARRLG